MTLFQAVEELFASEHGMQVISGGNNVTGSTPDFAQRWTAAVKRWLTARQTLKQVFEETKQQTLSSSSSSGSNPT